VRRENFLLLHLHAGQANITAFHHLVRRYHPVNAVSASLLQRPPDHVRAQVRHTVAEEHVLSPGVWGAAGDTCGACPHRPQIVGTAERRPSDIGTLGFRSLVVCRPPERLAVDRRQAG
jgi:hypothetical protein